MGEIADYFKRERYITRRFSLLVLGGTALLAPVALARAHGRIAAGALEWAIVAYVVCVAFAVVLIVRGARAKFPKSAVADDAPLDVATRRKLRRRIWLLEFFIVIYALALVYNLSQARSAPRLSLFAGVATNLLIEAALIKAIRRLKKKLQAATGAISPGNADSASRPR